MNMYLVRIVSKVNCLGEAGGYAVMENITASTLFFFFFFSSTGV
jgi:hypothetical protein